MQIKKWLIKYTIDWDGGSDWLLKGEKRTLKWLLATIVFTVVNVLFMLLSNVLSIPLWLDMVGVTFASYCVGPIGTALVALIANLIVHILEPVLILRGLTTAFVGIIFAMLFKFLAKRSLSLVFVAASAAGVVSALISTPLNFLAYDGYTNNFWIDILVDYHLSKGFPLWISSFLAELFADMIDRQLTVALCWSIGSVAHQYLKELKDKNVIKKYVITAISCILCFGIMTFFTRVVLKNGEPEYTYSNTDQYRLVFEDKLGKSLVLQRSDIEKLISGELIGKPNRLLYQVEDKDGNEILVEKYITIDSEPYESRNYRFTLFLGFAFSIIIVVISVIWYILSQQKEKIAAEERIKAYVDMNIIEDLKTINGMDDMISLSRRKQIAVFFIDIRGFTTFSENHDSEEVVMVLNSYFKLVTDCIKKNNGTLDKYIGDAVMAIYNAPNDTPNYALSAVKTAIDIKNKWKHFNEQFDFPHEPIAFGIGVHVGEAIVGNIGCSSHMDYTAVGDTVNTASRLESGADPGEILISKELYDMVKDKVDAEDIGAMSLKGKKKEVETYIVQGMKFLA